MKHKLLLFCFVLVLLTSCSTYKAGQTPDDVYFSPAREAVAKTEKRSTQRYNERYDNVTQEDDQYLRMKIRSRDRWAMIDDYDYWNDSRYVPYYTYNYYRNNWNNYAWNNWYPGYRDPNSFLFYGYGRNAYGYRPAFGYGYGYNTLPGGYFKNQTFITKRPPSVSRPELNGYNNRNYDNDNLGTRIIKAIVPSNTGYDNSNRNSNNTYSAPERTYNPPASSSSGSSSSSSSSSGGAVSRPARTGN